MNRADYRRLRRLERNDIHRHTEEIRFCAYADCFRLALARVRPPLRLMPRPVESPWASFLAFQSIRRRRVLDRVRNRRVFAEVQQEITSRLAPGRVRDITIAFACGPFAT